MTVSLRISYICIDALCIIQYSKDDWAREAALMDRVYADALVNLEAAASSDSSGELFRFREPRTVTPCSITLKGGNQALFIPVRPASTFSFHHTTAETAFCRNEFWQRGI